MNIYLAARYSRREELCQYRKDLESLGHHITSRWLEGGHETSKESDVDLQQQYAQEDLEDLLKADCCISFTEEPRSSATRGARHVEFGIALANGLRQLVVGHRENVFHCLPHVVFCVTWEQALHHMTRFS